ncbi:hypothetical protein MAR_ORF450 [Marseillevirus marseillevirus]|uniref:Uncharacterized protein n=1 Tax=Marseillevirus marseillevirus TaxID=694581 RepID=D2XB85_GBMV|nr:hypothetical protein MAR_ORF450 [Marseillevirus marseillevirus]ADB04212.1 hypothetical protein MAR_ORF450 [Marseillevirus marseillevirus]
MFIRIRTLGGCAKRNATTFETAELTRNVKPENGESARGLSKNVMWSSQKLATTMFT